jgi:hypothetical protein
MVFTRKVDEKKKMKKEFPALEIGLSHRRFS